MSKNFPPKHPDTSKSFLAINIFKGDKGTPAIMAFASPQQILLPCDADGENIDYENASFYLTVVSGNNIIGQHGDDGGWTAELNDVSNLDAELIGPLRIRVNEIYPDGEQGIILVRLVHASYDPVFCRVYVSKVYNGAEGVQGVPGIPGVQGNPGPKGDKGDPAEGFVVYTKRIHVRNFQRSVLTVTELDGKAVITTNEGDPDLVDDRMVGETIYVGSTQYHDGICKVTAIIDDTSFLTDMDFVDDDGQGAFMSLSQFRNVPNNDPQTIVLSDILPVGAKPDELALIGIESSVPNNYMIFDAGYAENPASGYDAYFKDYYFEKKEDIKQVNLLDASRSGYTPNMIISATDVRRSLYIRARLVGAGREWADAFMADEVFYLVFSYKYFGSIDIV